MRNSKVLTKLRNGEIAVCTQIGSAFAPFAAIAAQTDFDCIWLDTEHKAVSDEQVRECILACTVYDCDTVVRICKSSYANYFRPLEDGATGIMVPHCKSAEDARFAVKNTKFAPVGLRGMDFTGLSSDYMMAPLNDCISHSLENTFTMLQIEDVEALDSIDEIADVKGVDILFIGPGDLKQSALVHGVYSDTFMKEAYEKVNEAVKQHENMWWGTVVGTFEAALDVYNAGARFINIRGDFGAVFNGFTGFSKGVHEIIGNQK